MLHWPDLHFDPINLWNAPHREGAAVSPCVGRCQVQDRACTGCGRTLDEIAGWSTMTPSQRQAVIDRLAPQAKE